VPPESVLRLATVLRALQRPILLIHRPDAGHETSYDDAVAALEFVIQPGEGEGKDNCTPQRREAVRAAQAGAKTLGQRALVSFVLIRVIRGTKPATWEWTLIRF